MKTENLKHTILSYDVGSGSGLHIFGKRYDVHSNVEYIMAKLKSFSGRNEISK